MPYKDPDHQRQYQREWLRRHPRTPEQKAAHNAVNRRWRRSHGIKERKAKTMDNEMVLDSEPILCPDVMLPSQLQDRITSEFSPERRMWFEVLADAIFLIQTGCANSRTKLDNEKKRARHWALENEDACIGSFRWVCDQLGLESDLLRLQLKKNQETREKINKPRHPVRY